MFYPSFYFLYLSCFKLVKIKTLNDGMIFEGENAGEIVRKMKDSVVHNRRLDVYEYMKNVKAWMKLDILDTSSPEDFLNSLEEAGFVEFYDE